MGGGGLEDFDPHAAIPSTTNPITRERMHESYHAAPTRDPRQNLTTRGQETSAHPIDRNVAP